MDVFCGFKKDGALVDVSFLQARYNLGHVVECCTDGITSLLLGSCAVCSLLDFIHDLLDTFGGGGGEGNTVVIITTAADTGFSKIQ